MLQNIYLAAAFIASFFNSKYPVESFLTKPIVNFGMEHLFTTFTDEDQLHSSSNPTNERSQSGQIDSKCLKDLVEPSNGVDKAPDVACSMPHAQCLD